MIALQQSAVATPASTWFSFLNRERTVARPGYTRWLIPPAALCIHLCIGQAYAFSVFNLPMTKLIGVTQAKPADWSLTHLGWVVLGGFGLGIGYISPVSTLIKWFPDRPGMATGMAIMGFGGGAFIASPLSVWLMSPPSTPTQSGVAETFVVLGLIYFCFMMVGALIVRVPPAGWVPAGYVAPTTSQ